MQPFRRTFGVLSLLCFLAAPALATTFLERPFEATVQDAPFIVRGITGMSYSDWSTGRDGSRRIYTFTELEVLEVFKGDIPEKRVMMRELGGTKDGMGMEVSGTAKFGRGEDIVIMLGEKNPNGSYDVRGMMMGKYQVEKDGEGREVLSGPGLAQAHGHHPEGRQADTRVWTLDALREVVRTQGGAPAAPTPRNSPVSASPSPVAVNSPAPESAPTPAPGLQSSSEGAESLGSDSAAKRWIGWGVLLAVTVAFLLWRRNKTSR